MPGRPTARIEPADVERLEQSTRNLRAVDYQYGGGSCHRAVLSRLPRARMMLGATMSVTLARRLDTAVADLHNLAGWTLFDHGALADAMHQFRAALNLASRAGNQDMVANIRYRMGRVHLHHNAPERALAEFEQARRSAGDLHTAALLSANVAWANAKLGQAEHAIAALGSMQNEFSAADHTAVPGWAAFFTEVDVAGMTGSVYTDLARLVDRAYAKRAVPVLEAAIDGYGDGMRRSRAFCLISLSVNQLLLHDVDQAVDTGSAALVHGRTVRSARLRDRLHPLASEARRWCGAGELTEQIRAMLPAAS
jgi:tetratricopeptide (TPR) repeat protein